MEISVAPGQLRGAVRAPAAKSEAHRVLICAALADAPTEILLGDSCADTEATLTCLRAFAADISVEQPGRYRVRPFGSVRRPDIPLVLNCRESGATLRFLLPLAAVLNVRAQFEGGTSLGLRPLSHLTAQLTAHGAELSGDKLPLSLDGGELRGGVYLVPGDISSQYISGLLLALPLLRQDSEVILTTPLQSAVYVSMTMAVQARFGVTIVPTEQGYEIKGGQRYHSPGQIAVSGDWSGAAFFLTAAALGGKISVSGLDADACQGDKAILAMLLAMGAGVRVAGGIVEVERGLLTAVVADMGDMPDLLPPLAIAAAGAAGTSLFYHAARLRYKESDRITAVAELIMALGGKVREYADALEVFGQPGGLRGGGVDSRGDHRLVMAAAIASAISTGTIVISQGEAVTKSYPKFWNDFSAAGGKYHVL
ncbi:MAG: 3-phosphoshikimate 1-carboxyvinyltransferase [Clostridiales bacterium]